MWTTDAPRWGTCMDARGITDEQLVEEALRSTMDQLADRTLGADRLVTS